MRASENPPAEAYANSNQRTKYLMYGLLGLFLLFMMWNMGSKDYKTDARSYLTEQVFFSLISILTSLFIKLG